MLLSQKCPLRFRAECKIILTLGGVTSFQTLLRLLQLHACFRYSLSSSKSVYMYSYLYSSVALTFATFRFATVVNEQAHKRLCHASRPNLDAGTTAPYFLIPRAYKQYFLTRSCAAHTCLLGMLWKLFRLQSTHCRQLYFRIDLTDIFIFWVLWSPTGLHRGSKS